MHLEISALDAPVGALVKGWRPEEALDDETRTQVLQALHDYLVLVFRGQEQPSDSALIRFAKSFGDLILGSEWFRDCGEHPEILPVTNAVGEDGIPQGTGGSSQLEWHADYSYVDRPGKESFLNAVELPERSPRTYFCSQYLALETLPRETMERLRSLRATHSIAEYYGESGADHELNLGFEAKRSRDEALGIERPPIPKAEHPVIFRHPHTGREILYVSKGITKEIVGLSREESSALLKELHAHSTRSEAIYAHDWQVGDLVMFDTLGALHRRDGWDSNERRTMRQLSTRC